MNTSNCLAKIKHISEPPDKSGYYLVIVYYETPSLYYYDKSLNRWIHKYGGCLDDDELKKYSNQEAVYNLIYVDCPIDYEDFKEKLKLDYMFEM